MRSLSSIRSEIRNRFPPEVIRLSILKQYNYGWCAGCNPPSVLDGIRLNGLPAPPTALIGAYSPFHPAGRPFHRSHAAILDDLTHLIVTGWMDVPFLFRSQGSRPAPCSAAACMVGGVSSNMSVRKPSASSPTELK